MFRYGFRKLLVSQRTDKGYLLVIMIYKYVLYFLPLPVIWVLLKYTLKIKSQSFFLTFIMLGIMSSISLSIKQASSAYLTNYSYGERGTEKLIEFLGKEADPNDKIIASSHILFYLKRYDSPVPIPVWEKRDLFLKTIKDTSVKFVIYSITSNSVASYKNIFNSIDVLQYLNNNFRNTEIGNHTIWIREDQTLPYGKRIK